MDTPLALREFLEYALGHLIEHKDQASISHHEENGRWVYEVRLSDDDMRHIVGRHGHTAKALRSLMSAAATREGIRIALRIDPIDQGRGGESHAPAPDREDLTAEDGPEDPTPGEDGTDRA